MGILLKTDCELVHISDRELDEFQNLQCQNDAIVLKTTSGVRTLLDQGGAQYYPVWAFHVEQAVAKRAKKRHDDGRTVTGWMVPMGLFVLANLFTALLMAGFMIVRSEWPERAIGTGTGEGMAPTLSPIQPVQAAPSDPSPARQPDTPKKYPQLTDTDDTRIAIQSEDTSPDSADPLFGSAEKNCVFRPENVRVPGN